MKMKGRIFPTVQSIADAVSLFLVTSLASSIVTGRMERLITPITTNMAYRAPALFSRTVRKVNEWERR